MKLIVLTFALFLFAASAFTQKAITIKVPDFADAQAKSFYNNYTSVLIKCVEAIRQKDDAKAIALSKNLLSLVQPQEKYGRELLKNPVEKQKYMQWAGQVSPYAKEWERAAAVYKKSSGKK